MQAMDNSQFLSLLSNKLQTANRTVVMEKKREREEIQERIESIEAMFNAKKKFENDALEKAKFSVDRVTALTNQTVKGFNLKSKKEEELVRNLKEQTEADLENAEREHQDRIEEVIERQTDKMTELIEELTKKARLSSDTTEKSLLELSKAMTTLQKNLEDEIEQRQNNCRQIEEDISNELVKFNLMIDKQKQRRETSEQKITDMMSEIKNKITVETEALAAKRKKNNASLLKLIEGACQKLEQKLQIRL